VYDYALFHRCVTKGLNHQLSSFENLKTYMIGLNTFCEEFNVKKGLQNIFYCVSLMVGGVIPSVTQLELSNI